MAERVNATLALARQPDQQSVQFDLATFFGPRADIYLKAYSQSPGIATFNFNSVSLICGFVWYFYRKMYLFGALALLLPIVGGLLLGTSGATVAWALASNFAKSIYINSALRRIVKANDLGLTGAERDDYLRRAGGVSIVAGVLAGLLSAAFVGLVCYVLFFGRAR